MAALCAAIGVSMTYHLKKNKRTNQDGSSKITQKTVDRKINRASKTIEAKALKWAHPSIDSMMNFVHSDYQGLIKSEAEKRLLRHGFNEIRQDAPPNLVIQLFHAFNNPFIYILLGLAVISYFTDIKFADPENQSWVSIVIIIVMVSLSGILRFIQEYRSNQASEKLKSLVSNRVTVLRRENKDETGRLQEIEIKELVVGDIVQLEAGDMVPADLRLIDSTDLFVSQAVLTGEALPVEKYDTLGAIAAKKVNHGHKIEPAGALEIPGLCFMGTNVISGYAKGLVIATGEETYFGLLAKNVMSQKRVETQFDRGVNSVSWVLIKFMCVMVPIVFAINWYTKGDMISALTFALAVAVGLTPEMLPMIVSTNLAKGAIAMSRKKVVVKRLNSVQNLGAMDVLCTDKTGTLTRDHIILEHHLNLQGRSDENVLSYAWLNSFHQSGQKNLMDRAILQAGSEASIENQTQVYQKVDELPFDFIRRRLSVVLKAPNGEHLMITKGAIEEMLETSTHYVENGQTMLLDASSKQAILNQAELYNEEGFRVLLVATKVLGMESIQARYTDADETQLVIRGFLTFLDPPKETAEAAILGLQKYGVAVKVLTGDSLSVAKKVCQLVGLEVKKPLTGQDIHKLDDIELCQLVERTTLFAKLTPLQKSRVVKALQANGHTVGFLGDGINDAPALRDADVGISVDTAADIAKETADIILLEKSLRVLEEGVVKGRETFGNILKYLNMTASSNFGNVFSVLIASAWLPWEPMLAIHLLIQNLIYDMSQMVLPWDKMDEEFLKTPRKWHAPNISRFMLWLGPTSSVFDITTYILMWTVFGAGAAYALEGGTAGQPIMNSGWFIVGLVSQTLVVHMLRTRKLPFIQSCASWPIVMSTLISIAIACYLPFSPMAESIGFVALDGSYFYWLIATMVAYMTLTQIVKTIYIKRYGEWY